jgi:hypothetical protein
VEVVPLLPLDRDPAQLQALLPLLPRPTMSRRESRNSLNVRQNDALFEFENFKKRFLMANKQITKLNSTLSSRIEELNAQVSTLYTENLRLRASEISLTSQLKREREKSRKIMEEAETATLSLTKHFKFLRHSMDIPQEVPDSPVSIITLPKATRPTPNPDPNATPNLNKLSRVPTIPGITEDEETSEDPPSPLVQKHRSSSARQKPRLSASKLPLPSRALSPPPPGSIPQVTPAPIPIEVEMGNTKRKPSRRQSGAVQPVEVTERPPSPAFGSPIRKNAVLDEDEELASEVPEDMIPEPPVIVGPVISRKEAMRAKQPTREPLMIVTDSLHLKKMDKKRRREESEGSDSTSSVTQRKSRLQDVTNSPRSRTPEDPILSDHTRPDPAASEPGPSRRDSFVSPPPEPRPVHAQLPTPRHSSSPPPDADATGYRERRTRKSVNYAEPKLNTKMRKPDGYASTIKKRTSTSSKLPSAGDEPAPPPRPRSADPRSTRRRLESDEDECDDETSDGADADSEYIPGGGMSKWANVEGRRKSVKKEGRRSTFSESELTTSRSQGIMT